MQSEASNFTMKKWISKSTATSRQERRGSMGSMGCDDLSSKDSFCLSPNAAECVHGIPQWENPMESMLSSVSNMETSPSMWKGKPPVDTRRRNSLNNNSSNVVKHPISPQKQVKTQNPAYFAKMVIECDNDDKFNQSDGELTFDESLAHNDDYGSVHQNYHVSKDVMNQKERMRPPTFQSPTQTPSRTTSMRSTSGQSHPSTSTHSSSIPISPGMSLEEEEMRQLEIAMERSLQDYNSCASYGNGSLVSERSARFSGGGRNKTAESGGSSMIGAGCHLSMVSSSFRSNNVPTKSSSQNRIDALHAIVEENEASNRSMNHLNYHHHSQQPQRQYQDDHYSRGDYRSPNQVPNIDPNLAAARIEELEREKQMLEMVLKQSSNMHMDTNEIHFQPPSMSNRPTLASNRSINSMNTSELIRRPPVKSASVRSTDVSAGCHLQMYAARAQSTRQLLNSDSTGGGDSNNSLTYANKNNNNSNGSTASVNTAKMVWKRGPNGAWGRFVDDGIDYSNVNHHNDVISSGGGGGGNNNMNHNNSTEAEIDDEDAQIAEALRRSMQQM